MKILTIIILLVALAASEDHNVEKRSPDTYIYYPRGRGNPFTRTRGRFAPRGIPFRGGYLYELDDLYDDRRKRQTLPADSATHRQKRSADPDDVYFLYSPGGRAGSAGPFGGSGFGRASIQGRTRFAQTSFPFNRGYFYDFDDLYDDRRKRQTKAAGSSARRQKRDADFDDDDDDYFFRRYFSFAPTSYSTAARTSAVASPVVTSHYTVPVSRYFYDDDDDDFDFDDFEDYYRYVVPSPVTTYNVPLQPVATTQARTSSHPVAYTPITYYYDFDDKK